MSTVFCYRTPGCVWVEFRYRRDLLDLLRGTIPPWSRQWNPDARVHEVYDAETLAEFLALAEQAGHTPYWAPPDWWARHGEAAA